MMLILEVNRPWQWRPGAHRDTVDGRPFRRVWWGLFALAWTPLALHAYQEACIQGRVAWRGR